MIKFFKDLKNSMGPKDNYRYLIIYLWFLVITDFSKCHNRFLHCNNRFLQSQQHFALITDFCTVITDFCTVTTTFCTDNRFLQTF